MRLRLVPMSDAQTVPTGLSAAGLLASGASRKSGEEDPGPQVYRGGQARSARVCDLVPGVLIGTAEVRRNE